MANRVLAFVAVASTAVATLVASAAAQRPASVEGRVSVALVLAVDVSSSINDERFQLQRRGYADAFLHPAIIAAVQQSSHGRIAVTLVEWAGADAQRVVVPWMEISDAEGGRIFADQLLRTPRPFDGMTSISGAIDASVRLLAQSPYRGARWVIDVSGDGINNSGRPVNAARDAALAQDISINGLVIMADGPSPASRPIHEPALDEFYRDNVIGGTGAFVMVIDDFDSFAYAIVGKLFREIADAMPETGIAGLDLPVVRIMNHLADGPPDLSMNRPPCPPSPQRSRPRHRVCRPGENAHTDATDMRQKGSNDGGNRPDRG